MHQNILITGGAGFIGSHVADELLEHGYKVRVLDNLLPQVHGAQTDRPEYLAPEVELQVGDVRDAAAVKRALKGVDAVFHLAALVGVGQSMYAVAEYTSVNNTGTATLMQALLERPVRKLVVASSMSIYGEGLYRSPGGDLLAGAERSLQQLKRRNWEVQDLDGEILTPVPTPETKLPSLSSIYALSKYDQERMSLLIGRAYHVPTVALRFFNVYGTRQALSNPYTGVMAIFAARLLNQNRPLIFEDGLQQRDFVSVRDVARACRLALESSAADCVLNIGSGRHETIRQLARRIAAVMGKENLEPQITGKYRVGDVRHCFADISLARQKIGYEPRVTLEAGLEELVEWWEGQVAVDRVDQASAELSARGLTV
jgi:dTDP-L-rhamnose 4-epimerase